MTTASPATVRIGGRDIPVVPPRLGDARIQTSAVILTVHLIGITALGFRVSVPQILVSIVSAAVIDFAVTWFRSGSLVWPASGILTGSGVALIMRLVGMEARDYWSWSGWHLFAAVAAVSVLSKYLIRTRSGHVFNPSNLGLVAAFLVLGSGVVEPLDFWWAPMGLWMGAAYVVILGGGLFITRRLRLLVMAVAFWVAFAAGLGALAASGHCMTAAWSPGPVCDLRFWTVLVTSPELAVFTFFMITDPRTIPSRPGARLFFAVTLGFLAVLLIAPHGVEFGAKVGLLASLVLWSPLRGLFDRSFSAESLGETGRRITGRPPRRVLLLGAGAGSLLVIALTGVVLAGAGTRGPVPPPTPTVDVDVDPGDLPSVEVSEEARRLIAEMDPDELAERLAVNLAIEGEAIRRGDGSLLGSADAGERLTEMQRLLDEAIATGIRVVPRYEFDELSLDLAESEDPQSGPGLAFAGVGRVETISFDALGVELGRQLVPFQAIFVMRQVAGEHWSIVKVVEGG